MGVKAYISCPVSVDWAFLKKVVYEANQVVDEVDYWERSQDYNNNAIDESDVFIIVLPVNNFKYPIAGLPSGCYRELNRAKDLDLPIFIAYQAKMTGKVHFYEAKCYSHIEGIAGTSDSLFRLNQDVSDEWSNHYLWQEVTQNPCNEILIEEFTYDKRLLFMLQ